MNLRDQILSDIKVAMKGQDSSQLGTLRFLNSEIKNQEISLRPRELKEADVINVIKKLVKQRQDAIEQFAEANREDLVKKEKLGLATLEAYLPKPLSEERIEAVITDVMGSFNVTSMKQIGLVMKEVISRTAGQADNKLISELVKKRLRSIS